MADKPVTHVLEWWSLRPNPWIVDTVTWTEGTTTVDYQTGIAREQFAGATVRLGGVRQAFERLAGWSNGYVSIFRPGEAPWVEPSTPPA